MYLIHSFKIAHSNSHHIFYKFAKLNIILILFVATFRTVVKTTFMFC